MIDELIAEFARHLGLQAFDFLGLKFDYLAITQIDQMVVVMP